eukprot:g9158.t1
MADSDVGNGLAGSKLSQEVPSGMHSGRSSLRDVESTGVYDSSSSKYTSENYRRAVGASYVLTMGVSGIVLVALASSLRDIASALDTSSVAIGSVFLTRGIGAGLGNLVSPKLYKWARGKITISVALFLLAANLLLVPLADNAGTLHLMFLTIGFVTAISDAGCQLMTMRLHGSAAGPWLGANTVSFGLGGAFAPLIGWLTGSLMVEYAVLATVAFLIGCFLIVLPRPDVEPAPQEELIQIPPWKAPEGWSRPKACYEANKIDVHLCAIMFWFMGGRVTATAFLRQFAYDTSGSSQRSLLIVCLWLAITLGRVIGLRDQLTLTLVRLYRHAAALCAAGAFAMFVLLVFNRSTKMLWITVTAFGLFTGPLLGYGYDLSTRVSPNPVTSTAVAQFGITAGASVVPFLVSFPWYVTGWAFFLPLLVGVSHVIPFVLIRDTRALHGAANSRRPEPVEEGDNISQAAPTPTFGAPPSPPSLWSPAGSYFGEGREGGGDAGRDEGGGGGEEEGLGVATGGWIHRGAVRGAATSQQLDQRGCGKIGDSAAVKSATQKAVPADGQEQRGNINRRSAPSPYTISHGTTFNVGQGAASSGGGAAAMQSTAFPFSSSTAAAHWAHMQGNEQKLQKMARQSLLHELWQEQQRTHEQAVDWFLSNMPASYFRQTTEESRLQHLGAISSMLEVSGIDEDGVEHLSPTKDVTLHFERYVEDIKEVTFVQSTKGRDGGILRLLDTLPRADGSLQRVHVFPSRDGNLAIYLFGYVRQEDVLPELAAGGAGASASAAGFLPAEAGGGHPAMLEYLSRCEPEFVRHSHPRRFCKHRVLYERVTGTEGIAVDVEAYQGSEAGFTELGGSHWISIAAANVLPKMALYQALRLLKSYQLDTVRCHLDVVDDPGNGSVTMMRMLVNDASAAEAAAVAVAEGGETGAEIVDTTWEDRWDEPGAWEPVMKDLRRMKWADERVYEYMLERHPGLGLERTEVMVALANMVYGVLHKTHPWAYSKSQMYHWLDNPRYVRHATAAADLFCARFSPDVPMSEESAQAKANEIRAAIKRDVEHEMVQGLLQKMVDGVMATYRTNFFMPNRWGLSLRVDPRLLMTEDELKEGSGSEVPFGVFFVHGRRFNGFHCRFRDIARGGMRIVTPQTSEQVAIEAGRQFDECYALAYAQQLKNKDIPEGGSKAVLLVDTTNSTGRAKDHAVRKGVKAFSDALLDLLVDTDETRRHVKDLWGKQELLYLGPDEQVIPQDINWIIARAAQRKAPFPSAFMSSKPDAGINHKEYGVTSEGVFVFLDEALRNRGINPKAGQKFTLKLTGGPDGDVGGNMIKILNREYGDACLIVGVADGTGSAEDPEGLSHSELLRLFEEGLPISEYRFNKFGPKGILHVCDNEEGIRARNTMHNRVKADAFVPAGGRPGTINGSNWRSYLDNDGRPSSSLVVEGANLFTTPEARDALFKEAGVVFVKDSSANKCGVICSSFEIISSMLMTSEEFKENKEGIVLDVLEKLRDAGRREAELLFREHRNHPATPLPRLSERISNAINSVTDAVLKILDDASAGEEQEEHLRLLLPLFREHLPQKLVDVAFDRVPTTLPPQYLRNAMASCLACRVVYKEGINFIDAQPRDRLGELAFSYIREEGAVSDLAGVVEGSSDRAMTAEDKKKVADILRSAGVRASLGVY